MISPPLTTCPAKVFTPNRWAFESRPLRLEPSPFLCAIFELLLHLRGRRRFGLRFCASGRDLGHLDLGQVLTMAGPALVAALGLELEYAQLLAAHMREDLCRDLHLLETGLVEYRLLGAVEDRLECNVCALLHRQALDQQPLTALHAVLLAAGLHDRVHVFLSLDFFLLAKLPPLADPGELSASRWSPSPWQ